MLHSPDSPDSPAHGAQSSRRTEPAPTRRSEPAPTRRSLLLGTGATATLLASGCSYLNGGGASDGDGIQLRLRIWSDDAVAAAYEKSLEGFTKANPGVHVTVEQIPWASYWDSLRTDISAGDVADVFWVNAYNFAAYADNGNLVDVTKALPDAASAWDAAAIDLYTRKETLWGVPQLIDGGKVIYYNQDLLEKAGVDPSNLAWDPSADTDSLRQAATALTLDAQGRHPGDDGFDAATTTQFGFNAAYDFDAILANFVGSNGGLYQTDGKYVFADDPKTVEAIGYVVDLVDTDHVAPAAADTNADGSYSLTQFLAGKIGLFQSGAYNLKNVADGADFTWSLAPIAAGPAGRIPVTNSIIAAGSAQSEHPEETKALLAWLGTAEGSRPLGESGALIPAVTEAQESYFAYWEGQKVDAQIFTQSLSEGVLKNDPIPNAQAASEDLETAYHEIFAGRAGELQPALKAAQDHANEQIA